MRWVSIVVTGCIAACSFEHGLATTGSGMTPEAGVHVDSPMMMMDARAVDAGLPDATAACVGQSTKTYMGHHYFVTANGTWQSGQDTCSAFGGHLVKIETSGENAFVTTNFANGSYVWIGLHDPTNLDVYVWTDGSPLVGYNGFAGMLVPASASNCVDTNGTWDAYACTSANHGGLCECE